MRINWNVRLKNKTFLLSAGSAALLLAKQAAAAFGYTLPVNEITGVMEAALTLLVALGVVVDPTTAGVNDSERALRYTALH